MPIRSHPPAPSASPDVAVAGGAFGVNAAARDFAKSTGPVRFYVCACAFVQVCLRANTYTHTRTFLLGSYMIFHFEQSTRVLHHDIQMKIRTQHTTDTVSHKRI